jgi:hypothetical protein
MILSLIHKTVSYFVGDGFLFKFLGLLFLMFSSALAYYLKVQLSTLDEMLAQQKELQQVEKNNAAQHFYINAGYY